MEKSFEFLPGMPFFGIYLPLKGDNTPAVWKFHPTLLECATWLKTDGVPYLCASASSLDSFNRLVAFANRHDYPELLKGLHEAAEKISASDTNGV